MHEQVPYAPSFTSRLPIHAIFEIGKYLPDSRTALCFLETQRHVYATCFGPYDKCICIRMSAHSHLCILAMRIHLAVSGIHRPLLSWSPEVIAPGCPRIRRISWIHPTPRSVSCVPRIARHVQTEWSLPAVSLVLRLLTLMMRPVQNPVPRSNQSLFLSS